MKFSSAILILASAATVFATNTTITETDIETTLVTITSCSDNACHTSTALTGLTTVTTTVNGVITEYTTYCPLPTTTLTATEVSTLTKSYTPAPPTVATIAEGAGNANGVPLLAAGLVAVAGYML